MEYETVYRQESQLNLGEQETNLLNEFFIFFFALDTLAFK